MANRHTAKGFRLGLLGLMMVTVYGCGKSPNEGGWETKWKGKMGIIADYPDGSIFVGGGKDIDGQATIHINDTFYENMECRIIAIDRWGKIHTGNQKSKLVPEKKYRSTEGIFSGLTLKKVKEFHFQIRPYTQKTTD